MGYSGAGGKLIHEKNQKQKSLDTVPLDMKLFCFFNFKASELTTLGLGDELDSVEILRQRKLHSNITLSSITNQVLSNPNTFRRFYYAQTVAGMN
jgi:hypothetical protein